MDLSELLQKRLSAMHVEVTEEELEKLTGLTESVQEGMNQASLESINTLEPITTFTVKGEDR